MKNARLMLARLALAALLSCSAALVVVCRAETAPAPEPPLDAVMREQVFMLPSGSGLAAVKLQTTLFRPPGDGPFPLLIMNHGKAHGNAHLQDRARYINLSREFVKRGYAVMIPMRSGFAASGGRYDEKGCNIEGDGIMQSKDVEAALDYAQKQSWADSNRVLIAGQSHGGLTALAFNATVRSPGVKGIINFAGGLRLNDCHQWQGALEQAFAAYGAKARLPSLWFYGDNDSYFPADLIARMLAAYQGAGGKVQFVKVGLFKEYSHGMVSSADGLPIWLPETEKYLKQMGLPTEVRHRLTYSSAYQSTTFAKLDDAGALPHGADDARDGYRRFLSHPMPRAFVISRSGTWSYAYGGDDPIGRALASCAKKSKTSCEPYAVDDIIVWKDLL